jgi:septum site-determining protein MinC
MMSQRKIPTQPAKTSENEASSAYNKVRLTIIAMTSDASVPSILPTAATNGSPSETALPDPLLELSALESIEQLDTAQETAPSQGDSPSAETHEGDPHNNLPAEGAPLAPEAAAELPAELLMAAETQVRLKSAAGQLLLLLPAEGDAEEVNPASALTWSEITQQIKQRLNAGERFWQPDTAVHVLSRDRLLDGRQLHEIADTLAEAKLRLTKVFTSRRQTAVAAATSGYSVEQHQALPQVSAFSDSAPAPALADPLYLQTTLRSGGDVRHNGTVIVMGDVNPGSSIVAEGDILIWGRLRGIAHAGSKGNARCLILALQMEPTQLRIADFVARPPETPPAQYVPEVAYVTPQGAIRIARAIDFQRSQTLGGA